MARAHRLVIGTAWLLALVPALAWCQVAAGGVFETGDALLHRGDFRGALRAWDQAHEAVDDAGRKAATLPELLLRKGEALRRLGHVAEAAQTLRRAMPLAQGDPRLSATASTTLGTVLVALGEFAEAKQHLDRGLAAARTAGLQRIEASALNGIGGLHASQDQLERALDTYRESARLAEDGGEHGLRAQALANAARVAHRLNDPANALKYAAEAERAAADLAPGFDKTLVLLAVGELRSRAAGAKPSDPALASAHGALQQALDLARESRDLRSESYAWGYLGELYLLQGRFDEALELNGRAVFAAERSAALEPLYRWHWQRGRIQRAKGDRASAIAAYRQAVTTLQSIRRDLNAAIAAGQSSFRESLGPVFFELADLLLETARGTAGPGEAEKLLVEARDTIELSKVAELEDYFKDGCVAALQAKTAGITGIDKRTAVVYPILLQNRIELLVSFADGMRQYTVSVEGRAVATVARQFRYRLERRNTRHFVETAQRLYGWLIQPFEQDLARYEIDTLVFVAESGLRSIPMSALHDGKQFLVSRYAVAVTPGLTLTDPRPLKLDARRPEALLTGLSESVQGFAALPDVKGELAAIQNIQGGTVLLNQQYVVPNVEQEFSRQAFSVVHVASHGEFHGDPRRTFLLTYDGKLTMDNLERLIAPSRFRAQSIELLTLSACETAAGDDRAALGLAGVAVKAGARSALASLWSINDESTALLIEEFYRGLKQGLSKAKALQQAQAKLIVDVRYRHPGYWAPFLLIGNWL